MISINPCGSAGRGLAPWRCRSLCLL